MQVLNRLKSPVVLIQILGTIVGVLIFFMPNQTQTIQVIDTAVIAIINLLSGLNNPTDVQNF
jgi:uncharacterized membrane protein HdeD (DUF308 family)